MELIWPAKLMFICTNVFAGCCFTTTHLLCAKANSGTHKYTLAKHRQLVRSPLTDLMLSLCYIFSLSKLEYFHIVAEINQYGPSYGDSNYSCPAIISERTNKHAFETRECAFITCSSSEQQMFERCVTSTHESTRPGD